ncbi:YitT family protein [uncultured Tyzzerella sp.]|uniref:YitT family protein n=1 Tax=uncultured Tyzzerella sp. TaxID=2321398 RepID=UPI0029432BAC|nr:YitT family protein [uncultured Tyzzerella sp.]
MGKHLKNNKKIAHIFTIISVIISALLQTFIIKSFIQPAGLLSSGFTGVAILIDKISTAFLGKSISISFSLLALNLPVALLCFKAISKRFVLYSLLQVFLSSIFLRVLDFKPFFSTSDDILNVIFGGFLYGICIVLALKGRASTGGTDFIALYVSNKKGKSIWNYVFIFNVIILCIFGILFGWTEAGYSILFQYVTTRVISTFHQRYVRVTLQMTTCKPNEVVDVYIKNFRHGLSCVDAIGGYSKKNVTVIHTVVSSYEVPEIVETVKMVDPYIIINSFKTEQFYGRFYQAPLD